jgi:hypothetical protein
MPALSRSHPAAAPRPWRRRSAALGCVLAAALAAIGCGSSASSSSAAAVAPECLPATINHSARLAGTAVNVSPAPGTGTANPATQVSFVGVPVARIHQVSVVGALSGRHAGTLRRYSQDDGASFVPDKPLAAGEQVTVHATIGATPVTYAFRVDTPWSTAGVKPFANPPAAPSDYQTFATLPGVQAPVLSIAAADRDPRAGDILTSNGPGAGSYGVYVYTPQGRLVWVNQVSGGLAVDDLNLQTYQGQRDLTFWRGKVLSLGYGQGEDVVVNSHYQTVATVVGGNGLKPDLHDFQIAPGNIAYVTTYNAIRCDLSKASGPRDGVILDAAVQAIDMRTGLVRWEWHSLDHVDVNESEGSPPAGRAWDWFHINSVDPQPGGDVLISARNTWAVYQILAGTGTILWRLGGLKSSFAMGPGTKTAWQHDARMLADGNVTIFDDGSDPAQESQSRAVRIAIDLRAHRARLVSSYTHTPPLLAASQGNMQTLSSGNTVVGYGGVPQISEYAKDGSLLFDAHLSYDLIFYRAFRFPWSGAPLSPPAVTANLNNTAEETIVRMSWNGATAVASWRVLAGSRATSLRPQSTVAASGFETSAILPATFASTKPKSPGYVAVQALNASGHVLATSAAVAVASYAAQLPGGRAG